MGSNLHEYRLEDCMEAIIDYRGKTPKKTTSGIPLITAKIIKNGRVQEVNEFIAEEDYDSWMRRGIPKAGDVVLTTEAPLGEVAQLDDRKIALAQRVITLRGKKGLLDNDYLKYLLLSKEVQHQLDGRGTGTTVKGIKQSELREIKLRFPEFDVQRGIAHVLKTLDDKIELNRQTNQTLEQMAQALFKCWFVDFDPVIDNALAAGNDIPEALHHKAEQRKQAQQSPEFKPLPDDIRALFPNEFEQTDEASIGIAGWIPKGWSAGNLSSLTKFTSNRIDGTELTLDNYISTDNMLPNKGGVSTASKVPDIKTTPSFKPGDILISNIRPYFQKIWFATFSGGRSNDVLGFEANDEQCKEYLLNLLYQDVFFDYMMTTSKGSKMPRGDKKAIMDWPVVIPPSSLQKFFSENVKNYYQVIPIRNKESEALSQLRDILLPKLISGEITINKDVA